MTAVPELPTQGLPGGTLGPGAAPPTPHKMSGRRLSKSVMRSDSQDAEGSKGWGMVEVTDAVGTPRAVRVVQKAESEDFNMYKVSWTWSVDNKTYQVDLRHGRKSGIRKIYVNKELKLRSKNLKDMVADAGSTHEVQIDEHIDGIIRIEPKSAISGFTYQLYVNGNPIEQNIAGPMTSGPLDIGERTVGLPKSADGLGMTLRNNPLGPTGVVVWTVEPGKAAEAAGFQVGDVVLSVSDEIVNDISPLLDLVAKIRGDVVYMELAGTSPSRVVELTKNTSGEHKQPIGLGLQTTSCGVGVLVTEIDKGSSAAESELRLGEVILSVDGMVPASPKDAVHMILKAGPLIRLVVIGDAQETFGGVPSRR